MLVGEADGGVPLSAAAYQQLQVDATPPYPPFPLTAQPVLKHLRPITARHRVLLLPAITTSFL